jgi:uncharacterized protein YjeT (DUF2065 family)
MHDFVAALGLAMAIEGFAYALFPDGMKRMMLQVMAQPSSLLRTVGLALATTGVIVVWMVRG